MNPPSNQGNSSMSITTSSEDIDAHTNDTVDSENASKAKKTKPSKKPALGKRTTKRSKLPPVELVLLLSASVKARRRVQKKLMRMKSIFLLRK